MSLLAVARKDFADARRSRGLIALAVLFVIMGVGGTFLYTILPTMDPSMEPVTADGLYFFLGQISTVFIAISALVLSYKAIAGESESGSAKLLLGLPHSRLDVFLGKVLGRSAVMVVGLLLGLLATFGIAMALIEGMTVMGFGLFVMVTLAFGLVYVTLFVSISASTTSTTRAATVAIGLFVVLELFWDVVVFAAAFVSNGFAAPADGVMPTWVLALSGFEPSMAYGNAVSWVSNWTAGTSVAVPFFQQLWFALVVLAVWALIPAFIGYTRYNRADL